MNISFNLSSSEIRWYDFFFLSNDLTSFLAIIDLSFSLRFFRTKDLFAKAILHRELIERSEIMQERYTSYRQRWSSLRWWDTWQRSLHRHTNRRTLCFFFRTARVPNRTSVYNRLQCEQNANLGEVHIQSEKLQSIATPERNILYQLIEQPVYKI